MADTWSVRPQSGDPLAEECSRQKCREHEHDARDQRAGMSGGGELKSATATSE